MIAGKPNDEIHPKTQKNILIQAEISQEI